MSEGRAPQKRWKETQNKQLSGFQGTSQAKPLRRSYLVVHATAAVNPYTLESNQSQSPSAETGLCEPWLQTGSLVKDPSLTEPGFIIRQMTHTPSHGNSKNIVTDFRALLSPIKPKQSQKMF